ncbi:MAG: hypothetical protein ACE5I0_08505 [Candidatus Binatia bacterium]
MYKQIDLSQAVPPNTVAITFRYEITSRANGVPLHARMANNANGDNPILLSGESGKITVRLRTTQKLFFSLENQNLHLNLWILEYRALPKHSC